MAALEPDRLVVRVVYAGAPLAGKTASVRALMPLLKGPGAERLVMSPAEDRGRTAFFDWADYEGGAFEGRPIHCQIASAPGQIALSERRELVLRGADAVILVVDSRSEAIERTLQCYEEMAPWLEEAGRDAPIRVLLQCNKQDLPGSLSPQELSRNLGLPFGKDIYATSARTTKGLRGAFVAGVRAAVERARLLLDRGLIDSVAEIGSAEELLERMQLDAAERSSPPETTAPARAERGVKAERGAMAERREPPPLAAAPGREPPVRSERRTAAAPGHPSRSLPERARPVPARARGRRVASEPRLSEPRLKAERLAPQSTTIERAARPGAARPPRLAEPPAEAREDRERVTRVREPAPPTAPLVEEVAEVRRPSPSAAAQRPITSPPHSAARDWTPGSSPRPAVMPASAYYALVGPPVSRAEVEAWGIPDPVPAAPAQASPKRAAPAALSNAALSNAALSKPRAELPRAADGKERPRPAVMPASAYFADQRRATAARESASPSPAAELQSARATPNTGVTPSAASLIGRKRPAVMPAAAYFALLRRFEPELDATETAASSIALPSATNLDSGALELAPDIEIEQVVAKAGVSADAIRVARPAVIPMAAWRSGQWSSRTAAVRSTPPAVRALPRAVRGARPAVLPMSAWLEMERANAELAAREKPHKELHAFAGAPPANDDPPSFAPRSLEAVPGFDEVKGVPRLPGQVPPRSAWPRATWRQLAPLIAGQTSPRRDLYGRFIAEIAPGWYARSLDTAPDLRSARRCLARAVLRQRGLGPYLSGPRCLVLTEEADRFWVWQIVYRVPTLAVTLGRMLDGGEEPSAVADVLLEVASGYLEAREKFAAAPEPLPLSLQALSAQEGKLVYAGLLPKSDSILPPPAGDSGAAFEEALRRKWPGALSPAIDAGAVVAELQRKAVGRLPDPIVEIIRGVLIRH